MCHRLIVPLNARKVNANYERQTKTIFNKFGRDNSRFLLKKAILKKIKYFFAKTLDFWNPFVYNR